MPADVIWKVGDTQPSFADTLKYSNNQVPPLQGATIALRMRSLANTGIQTLTGVAQIINPNTGDVAFTPSAADTAVPGNYLLEWVVTFAQASGLGQQTFPTDGFEWASIEPSAASAPRQILDLGDVKNYLSIAGNDRVKDSTLLGMISAITPLLESEVGPLVPRIYEEWHDGGSNTIQLHRDPGVGMGSDAHLKIIAASEYRGPIEYPLSLVASPSFGSIYSIMVVPDYAAITRRSAGGRTIAFMPGRESVHVIYEVGQNTIPPNVTFAAKEALRVMYRWPQQIGRGSMAPADQMEMGAALHAEVTRIIRMWTRPMHRFPSFA